MTRDANGTNRIAVGTHNPKVDIESIATLPSSSASGLGFDPGRQESPGPGFEICGSDPAPATKKTLGIPTFLRVFSRSGVGRFLRFTGCSTGRCRNLTCR
jgi:hypothetical protein